jgi:hypothetical protein
MGICIVEQESLLDFARRSLVGAQYLRCDLWDLLVEPNFVQCVVYAMKIYDHHEY